MDVAKSHTADDTLDIIHTVVDVLDKGRDEPGQEIDDHGHEAMPMGNAFVNEDMTEEDPNEFGDEEKIDQPWDKKRNE